MGKAGEIASGDEDALYTPELSAAEVEEEAHGSERESEREAEREAVSFIFLHLI